LTNSLYIVTVKLYSVCLCACCRGQETFDFFCSLLRDYGSSVTGIMLVPGYELFDDREEAIPGNIPPYWSSSVLNFKELSEQEMQKLGLAKLAKFAFSYTSVIVEMTAYLQFCMREFKLRGGQLVQGFVTEKGIKLAGRDRNAKKANRTFHNESNNSTNNSNNGGNNGENRRNSGNISAKIDKKQVGPVPKRDSLLLGADLVINCSGLGSLELVADTNCYPIRGQLAYINYPSLFHFYMLDKKGQYTYIFPRRNDVACGGTYEKNNWNLIPDEIIKEDIIQRCTALVPDIVTAPIVKQWVGLRPARNFVRFQLEQPQNSGQSSVILSPPPLIATENDRKATVGNDFVPIIHNYGHGGSGMTLHWGCSNQIINLVKEIIPGKSEPALRPHNPSEQNGFALQSTIKSRL
jgi:hypothetical protein